MLLTQELHNVLYIYQNRSNVCQLQKKNCVFMPLKKWIDPSTPCPYPNINPHINSQ